MTPSLFSDEVSGWLTYYEKCKNHKPSKEGLHITWSIMELVLCGKNWNFLLQNDDYNRLIDIKFTFKVNNFVCDKNVPLLIILVHTAPSHIVKRNLIRRTWGKTEQDIKIVFLLGTHSNVEIKDKLEQENLKHKDIVQGSFLDSYRNLTYKHVMGLKYVVYHCAQAKYVLKVDDDTCVNTPLLRKFLVRDLSPYGANNLLMGNVVRKAMAYRGFRSKWKVSFNEYRPRYYPIYCLGWYTLYSRDILFGLYKEAQQLQYFWLEDVFGTGFSAAKLNFSSHTDISALTLSKNEFKLLKYCPINRCRPFLFGWSDMDENEILDLWRYIMINPVPHSVKNETIES
ncbi:hypothetical protein NQ315_012847 [Exocentrus adspersus]|uniref:Hexosyltransferase n=1 Tax=Exocentrus adspersus TaxID=1586481 RepID=A0AAV8V669_9CUCU|nr:hypothetical protein NQ315_012847 [Exocentrus adspersus]